MEVTHSMPSFFIHAVPYYQGFKTSASFQPSSGTIIIVHGNKYSMKSANSSKSPN